MNGLVRFEVEYGTKLGTYLLYWIRQSISAAISTCGRLIQVPRHHEEAILQLRKQRSRLQTCLQRQATCCPASPQIFSTSSDLSDNLLIPGVQQYSSRIQNSDTTQSTVTDSHIQEPSMQ